MSTQDVKRGAGAEGSKRPPGTNSGGFFNQRRGLLYSPYTMALAGLAVVGSVWYFTMYTKKKPEHTSARDVARVSGSSGEDTRPRKL